jgi:hypothetical protein
MHRAGATTWGMTHSTVNAVQMKRTMNPNPYPQGRWSPSASASAGVPETRLRELFWSVPESSTLLEEAEQRITATLRKVLTPEPVQLFDDLYEDVAC